MKRKVLITTCLITICLSLLSYQLNAQYFNDINVSLITSDLIGISPRAIAWADYDNDGDLDILVETNIYRNDGNDVFVDINAGLSGNGSADWGDYDNDDDLDILLGSKIYRNDGDGIFAEISAGLTSVDCSSVEWGDYDNDGDLDVLIAGGCDYQNAICKIYRNDGSNVFTDINVEAAHDYAVTVHWGDYDNDDDLDMLYGEKIYRNDGSDSFTLAYTLSGGFRSAWVDYDNDGNLDISLTGDGPTIIYRNNSDETFTNINVNLTINYDNMGTTVWGDFDDDGDQDVIITRDNTFNGSFEIYRNDGADNFTDISAGLPYKYGFADWGDYDNDNDLDILLVGVYNENVDETGTVAKVYENSPTGDVPNLNNQLDVVIYPNPANSIINIEGSNIEKIEIANIQGQVIRNISLLNKNSIIDISELANGVYTLKIQTKNALVMKKILKQ